MSNHFSAAMLKFPGDDPRLDLTDVFVFASPERLDFSGGPSGSAEPFFRSACH